MIQILVRPPVRVAQLQVRAALTDVGEPGLAQSTRAIAQGQRGRFAMDLFRACRRA